MSTENVYKLLALGEQDAGLRAAIQGSGDGEAGAKAMVALGQQRKLDFTADELLKVAAEMGQGPAKDGALSEDDLKKVSGGVWNPGGGSRDTFAQGRGCVYGLPNWGPKLPNVLPGVPTPSDLPQEKRRGVLPGVPTPQHLRDK